MQKAKTLTRVCLTPQVSGVGGMVSFQANLKAGLDRLGIQVTHDLDDEKVDAVLVVGGTRQLVGLGRVRRRGIPLVQRLDGINWLHRRLRTGMRHWARAEIGNWLLAYIRERLATRIVYQSQFVKEWWGRKYGPGPQNNRVNHNGADLDLFRPPDKNSTSDHIKILMVEGSLHGGYDLGIDSAVKLAETLGAENEGVKLVIAGQVTEDLRLKWNQRTKFDIQWAGVITNDKLPELYGDASLLFSGDLNAACPNSVIEALACGLPVLAFDTGALKELVPASAGRVVPYGGDPWKLDPPNIPGLVDGAKEILANQNAFKLAARAHAEYAFSLDKMVNEYIEALSG